MPKAKKETEKTTKPAKTTRELAVNIEKAEESRATLDINDMAQDAENEEIPGPETLLDQAVEDLDLVMPAHHHAVANRPHRWYSRNSDVEPKVKAMILNHTPRYLECDAELPLKDLQAAKIYPTRWRNSWLYPVLIDEEGNYHNWPRQQNVALNTSSYILWLARNWPEHKVLNKTGSNWWQKATGYGIIFVVVLIIIVIFMLMFFFITGD